MNQPGPVIFQGRRFSKWVKLGVPALGLGLFWFLNHEVPLLFTSLVISCGFYYMLNPVVDFLETRHMNRAVASIMVLIGITCVMYLIWLRFVAFGMDLRDRVDLDAFQKNMVNKVEGVMIWAQAKAPVLKRWIEPEIQSKEKPNPVVTKKTGKLPSVTDDVQSESVRRRAFLEEKLSGFLKKLVVEQGPELARTLAGLVPNLILIPYFTFFFLKDGRKFKKTIIAWIPNQYFEPALKFFYEIGRRMRSYLQSMFLDCTLVGLLVGVGSALVGAPYPVVFGLIAFALNSIPLLGPLAYGATCLAITIGAGKPSDVILGFIGVFFVSRICDDLIFIPTIYGKSHHMHQVLVICAVLLGESVAGIWGMFLAIPIISILFLGVGIIREISQGEEPVPLPSSASPPFA